MNLYEAKKDISQITIPFYVGSPLSNKSKKDKPVLGFDTETEDGYAVMITDSTGKTLVSNNVMDYLEFLFTKRYRTSWNFFYNIDYDFRAIIKYLSNDLQEELYYNNSIEYNGYKIRYIPNKAFKISKWSERSQKFKNGCTYWNAAQYYVISLKKAGDKYNLIYKKGDIDDVTGITYDELKTNSKYYESVKQYCILDSKVCQELMERFITLLRSYYPQVKNFLSVATISRQIFGSHLHEKFGMPYATISMQNALNCYHAGYIQTFKMGAFEGVYTSDINSAYPAAMCDMPNPKGEISTYPEYDPDADYSYYHVCLDFDDYVSPLWYIYQNINYHPVGESFKTWISKPEFEYLMDKTDLKIIEAHHIYSIDKEPLFKDLIEDLYALRMEAKKDGNDMLNLVLKTILNAFYGTTMTLTKQYEIITNDIESIFDIIDTVAERPSLSGNFLYRVKFVAGGLYNPMFGNDITARTRVTILKALEGREDSIISINTDGIKSTKKLKNIKYTAKLGDYSLEYNPEKVITLGNAREIHFIDDEVDNKSSIMRGINLPADEIVKTLESRGNEVYVPLKVNRVVGLHQSLYHEKDKGQMNAFKSDNKFLSFIPQTRAYEKPYFTYNELKDQAYDSFPLKTVQIPDFRARLNKILKENQMII